MKCQVKLTLCVVLLPLCMLTKGQIIYDTELQRNGLNEELKRQLNGVNLRTTALYNVVRTMEQSLLEQGLLEKPSNTDSIELGMSYDVNSKLLSLERILEREITNSRHQEKTLHSRMHLLESEITVMASNIKHVASYVQSKTTKSRKLKKKLKELEKNFAMLSKEMTNHKNENNMFLQRKINSISKSNTYMDKTMNRLTRLTKDRAFKTHGIKQTINNVTNEDTVLKKENLAFKNKNHTDNAILYHNQSQIHPKLNISDERLSDMKAPDNINKTVYHLNSLNEIIHRMSIESENIQHSTIKIPVTKVTARPIGRPKRDVGDSASEQKEHVMNITEIITVSNSLNTQKHEMLEKKVLALEVNMTSLQLLMVNKEDSDKRRQNVLNNLAKQQNRLKATISRMLRQQTTTFRDMETNIDNLNQQLQSRIQINTQNISKSYSELAKIVTEVKEVKYTSAQNSRSIDSMKSELYQMSSFVNEFTEALGNSTEQCLKSTQRLGLGMQESQLKIEQNFTEFQGVLDNYMISIKNNTNGFTKLQSDFGYLTSSMRNHSEKMLHVEDSHNQHKAKLVRLEEDIIGIAMTMNNLESQISRSTALDKVLTNVTTNKQNIRHLLSFVLDLQQNVSLIQIFLTKVWRQCNSTEEYVKNMTLEQSSIQDLNSTSVKLKKDLQAIRELSSIVWHQCNKSEEQAMNISRFVSVLNVSNARRHKLLEQELFATQENISSLYAFVTNDAGKVNALNETIKDLQQTVFYNLTQENHLFNSIMAEKFQLLETNFSNIKNISNHVRLSMQILRSDIQQNAKNITIYHAEISKLASEQNKANVHIASINSIQSNLSSISTSFKELHRDVNKSITEGNNFTLTYVSELETQIQMIKNNFSEFHGDLYEVMTSVQNLSHGIATFYRIQEGYRERFTVLEESLSVIANTTTNLELVTSSLCRFDDAISNVSTVNANNFRDLRLTSLELQQNLSSLWKESSMIWQQCNATEDRVQNISTIIKVHPFFEEEILKIQFNISALVSFVEWFANETRNILTDQADKQSAFTTNLEYNLIKYINSSGI